MLNVLSRTVGLVFLEPTAIGFSVLDVKLIHLLNTCDYMYMSRIHF